MPSREAYARLRELVLEELPEDSLPGSIAYSLVKKHGDELVALGLVPERGEWDWKIQAYGVLKPKVRRQLENLVSEGKAEKREDWQRRDFLNTSVRRFVYKIKGGETAA